MRDVDPHHGVSTAAWRLLLGVQATLRQPGVDLLNLDRSLAMHTQVAQTINDTVGRLTSNVGKEQISLRTDGRAPHHRQAADSRLGLKNGGDVVTQCRRNKDLEP